MPIFIAGPFVDLDGNPLDVPVKNAECKVTLDREGNLDIIVNPPGESGEAEQHGGLPGGRRYLLRVARTNR